MQIAINSNNERVHILNAERNGLYTCPICGFPLIQKHGEIKIAHFAHASGNECTDNWHYEMSEWHLGWQSKYPVDCSEIIMGNHRADIFINDTVIEFQHSPMSPSEFEERNAYYNSLGYPVIWLFDEQDSDITPYCGTDSYSWKYARKTLSGFNPLSLVHVYLQIGQDEIIRLVDFPNQNTIITSPSEHYSCDSFFKLTTQGKKACDTPHHMLRIIRRPNGEKEVFGCPINSDSFSPLIKEESRKSCSECQYFLGNDEELYKCTGRFRDLEIRDIIDPSAQLMGHSI